VSHHLDEIDRRIIHALMRDARNTSAPMIAEGLNVSAGTVRNRIDRLEEEGVIRGYTAVVDFERAGTRLAALYMCTVPADEREELALAARSLPGVINAWVLMAGRRDLQVVAVGEDTGDLRGIARSLSELDIRIEDEELLQTEIHSHYSPFGPASSASPEATNVLTLADGTPVLEVCVAEGASIVGLSPAMAREKGLLPEGTVVVSVERDGSVIQPADGTRVQADDVVTIIPRGESDAPPDSAVPSAFLGTQTVT